MKRSLFIAANLVLVLALVLSFGIAGCTGEEETTPASTTPASTTPTSTTPTSTTPTSTTPPETTTPTPVAPKVVSIEVTPASPADLTVGSTQAFRATATYSDGSTGGLFSVDWSSDNPGVATIDSKGVATGVAPGITNITATQSGITSSPVSLTVVAPPPPEETTTPPEETTEPAGTTVYVSVSVNGELLVAAQPVTITDMTVEAVLIAAHEAFYADGLDGYTAGIDPTFGMYLVSQCWGIQNTPYIVVNDAPLGSSGIQTVDTTTVAANDNIIICTGTDTATISPVALTATVSDDTVTITAMAWTLSFATFTYSSAPLAGATVIDPTTGEVLGTTDENGQITITIPASGIVAIEGMAAINVLASAT